jgi:hypothetical protein
MGRKIPPTTLAARRKREGRRQGRRRCRLKSTVEGEKDTAK